MGVPALFRWLAQKYPQCIVECKESSAEEEVDMREANPNNYEWDNLYLDMNCLIHPCVRPHDKAPPETILDMYKAITDYVDRIVTMIRPRKVLYLAIDGVAPRAKMNQQRARRFRSSWDEAQASEAGDRIREEMRERGMLVSDKKANSFDKNVITPGTGELLSLLL